MIHANEKRLITTVTLNAALDKTYTVPTFQKGKAFRINKMIATAGGKGINVARVAATLGESVVATGFVAGTQGQFITEGLEQEHIPYDFVKVSGESRLCITVLDPANPDQQTELLEPGPFIEAVALAELTNKLCSLAKQSAYIVLSGSLPQGCSPDTYCQLIRAARNANPDVRIVLDTSNEALALGIQEKPFLIKPNEHEIECLIGKPIISQEDLYSGVRLLMEQGIGCVVVSLGGDGAVAGYEGTIYRVTFPPLSIINPVGSGDAMVAGMVVAFQRNEPIENVLRWGSACGTANALMMGAGFVDPEQVKHLSQHVQVAQIHT